jgi:prepilin-type N-terminal cleavage/methylation domain-containing protein
MRTTSKRTGFTLIELMVVMAIIAFLAATVMLVAPSVLDKDRARDAATQLQGALQNARVRAMRDGLPRGVRLLIDGASQGSMFTTASSYQYIEVPSWLLLTNQSGTNVDPYLQLSYTLGPQQQVTSRTCSINNLSYQQYLQLQQLVNGNVSQVPPVLGLPTINFWSSIIPGSFVPNPVPKPNTSPCSCTVMLTIYPDSMLGAQTLWIAPLNAAGTINATSTGAATISPNGPAYFGIYQPQRPLLGEPIVSMPLNTIIDLSDGVSRPSFTGVGGNIATPGIVTGSGLDGANAQANLPGYDILFAPSGQMIVPYGISQVFLWVRDSSKGQASPAASPAQLQVANVFPPNPDPARPLLSISPIQWQPANSPTLYTPAGPWYTTLATGGEQLLVTIKANSGGTGVSPIFTPVVPTDTPYNYALKAANSP